MAEKSDEKFTVYVDDNFHYQEEDERYVAGECDKYEEALTLCKNIVDQFLDDAINQSGPKNADALYKYYMDFGPDPFIRPDLLNSRFSAWGYAKERCEILYSGQDDS
jgi:hypothetical protein